MRQIRIGTLSAMILGFAISGCGVGAYMDRSADSANAAQVQFAWASHDTNPASAIALLEQVPQDSPWYTEARYRVGRIREKNSDFTGAMKAYQKVIDQAQPGDSLVAKSQDALVRVSQAKKEADQQAAAELAAKRAASHDSDVEALTAGQQLLKAESYEGARAELIKVEGFSELYPAAQEAMGDCAMRQKRYSDAQRFYQAASDHSSPVPDRLKGKYSKATDAAVKLVAEQQKEAERAKAAELAKLRRVAPARLLRAAEAYTQAQTRDAAFKAAIQSETYYHPERTDLAQKAVGKYQKFATQVEIPAARAFITAMQDYSSAFGEIAAIGFLRRNGYGDLLNNN